MIMGERLRYRMGARGFIGMGLLALWSCQDAPPARPVTSLLRPGRPQQRILSLPHACRKRSVPRRNRKATIRFFNRPIPVHRKARPRRSPRRSHERN